MANSCALSKPWALEPVLLFPSSPSASPSQKGVFPTAARLCHATATSPLWRGSRGQGEEEEAVLLQSSGRGQSWKRAVAVLPPLSPDLGAGKEEKQEGSACVLPLGEPKGVPRAKEDPKALSQRQQAKELMWLWSRKQHSQRWEGPP